MKDKKTLKDKIVEGVFIYETKRFSYETLFKVIILLISAGTLLVFGGVIWDIFTENEMGGLLVGEIGSIIFEEIPAWVFLVSITGLITGCILIGLVIKNRKLLYHKIISIFNYWAHL